MTPGPNPANTHLAYWTPFRKDSRGPPRVPPQIDREPDDVHDRYDRLHTWRKNRARARGVESDVILPRSVLLELARHPPSTPDELAHIPDFGPWRREQYAAEIPGTAVAFRRHRRIIMSEVLASRVRRIHGTLSAFT